MHRGSCRDPVRVSVSVKSAPDAQSLSQAGTPGTPMISVEERVWSMPKHGRQVSTTVDEMRWPSGDGDAPPWPPGQRQEMESAHSLKGKLGKEGTLSVSANMEQEFMKEENDGAYSGGFFFFSFT